MTDEKPAPAAHVVDAARLIEQVRDYAIIALDPDGTIMSWNAGAQRLNGYTAEEAVGRSLAMFYPEADQQAGLPLQLLERARREGSVEHTGWRVRKDGTRFWGDVIITALIDDEGQLTGYAKVTRDLTERKQLEEAQESFLAAIAHDFRTPVTAMKGFTELARGAGPDELESCLTRIDANADRLMQMMGDLMSYASHHSVAAPPRPEPLDLARVARETVQAMVSAADLERVDLPGEPVEVVTDKAALERIVSNLVSNALKYSDGGVEVAAATTGEGVRLVVRDHGRGIDPGDLGTIFDEFERGRLAQDDGGQGLGLTSVRTLVDELGGRVSIESVVAQGTTVTVELPRRPSGSGSSASSSGR